MVGLSQQEVPVVAGSFFHDITPLIVELKGARVLLNSCYLTAGLGLQHPENQAKLRMVVAAVQQYRIPWMAMGDFN
eukprot:5168722-Lingulodinium_polyedra.AAC.1